MTDTSVQAYEAIKADLPAKRAEVLLVLERHDRPQGWTKRELEVHMNNPDANKRLTELWRAGVIQRDGKRKCTVSDQVVTVWRVQRDPTPRPKPPPTADALAEKARWHEANAAKLWEQYETRKREIAPEGQQELGL